MRESFDAINDGRIPAFMYVFPNNSRMFLLNLIEKGEWRSGYRLKLSELMETIPVV